MVFYPCRSSSSSSRNQQTLAHTLNDLEQNDNSTTHYTKKEMKQFKTVKRSKAHVDNVLYNNRHSGRKSLLSSDGVVLFAGFVDWITLKRLRENKERGTKYEVSTEEVQLSTPAFEQVSRIDPVKSGFMARKSDRDGGMKCAVGTLVKDEWAEQCRKSPPRPTAVDKEEEDKEEIGLFCTPQKKDSGGGTLLFGSSGSGGIMDMCSISPTTNTAGVNDSFGTASTMASSCHGSPRSSDIKKSNNNAQEESNKEEESIWCDVFGSVLEEETDDSKNRQQQQLLLLLEEEEERKKKLNTPEKKIRGIQNVEVVYGDDDKKKRKGRRKSWFSRSSPKKKKSSTTPSLSFREKYL
jgi:hypothetical protein